MKKKELAALFMAGVMSLGLLAGCSSDGGEASQPPASQAGTQSSQPNGGDGDTQGNTEAVTIKVGGIGPITGDLAQYGLATQWGAQIAVDEINALGGPIKLEYDFQDDTGVTDTAVSAYNTLKDWDVDVIYGCTTTAPCVAVASETFADRYFQLTPSASSPDVTADKDNAFQMCFTDPGQGMAAAEYLKNSSLGTKLAVIYNNGDMFNSSSCSP